MVTPLVLLPRAATPETEVPRKLPCMVLRAQLWIDTPEPPLHEITLRLVGSVPPIQLPEELSIQIPPERMADWPLPWFTVPEMSVPMKLP